MMLQGFNMLSIARIGGHLHLRSQLTYTSHLDYFARARVRVLSEQIKRNRERNLGDTYLSDTNSLIVRSKLYSQNESSKPIQDGFCHDKNFPDNCIDDCVFCPYHTLDLTKPDVLKDLSLKSNIINQNIKDQISTMQRISNDMMYDTQTLQYSHEEQEKLFNLANKLNKLFNKKALLDSYLENYEEDK